ncbi:hypothetical protein FRC01_006966, partial [Tulasnella sp. 417]
MSANDNNKDSASPNALERGDAPVSAPTTPAADATHQPDSGLRNRKEPIATSYPPSSPISPAVRTGTQRSGITALNSPLDASALTAVEPKHSKRRMSYWQALMKPKKKVGSTPTWSSSLRAI